MSGLSPDSYKTQELIIFAKLPGSIDKHSQESVVSLVVRYLLSLYRKCRLKSSFDRSAGLSIQTIDSMLIDQLIKIEQSV